MSEEFGQHHPRLTEVASTATKDVWWRQVRPNDCGSAHCSIAFPPCCPCHAPHFPALSQKVTTAPSHWIPRVPLG